MVALDPFRPVPPRETGSVPEVSFEVSKDGISNAANERNVGTPEAPVGESKTCKALCEASESPRVPALEIEEPVTEKIDVVAVNPTFVTVPPEPAAEIEIEPAVFVIVTPEPATIGFKLKPEPLPTKMDPDAAVEPSRPIPPRAADSVPEVIFEASRSGIRAVAKVPD